MQHIFWSFYVRCMGLGRVEASPLVQIRHHTCASQGLRGGISFLDPTGGGYNKQIRVREGGIDLAVEGLYNIPYPVHKYVMHSI